MLTDDTSTAGHPRSSKRNTDSTVRIGLILPEVLGTYGDSGNATVLCKRLEWRGFAAEVVPVHLGEPVPASLDLYLLGGGEDDAQALGASHLRRHPGVRHAAENGAPVLGICAGLQILGTHFTGTDGVSHLGLGLLDVSTRPGKQRSVSEVVASPGIDEVDGRLTGFENHLGLSTVGTGSTPLGKVMHGTGNGDGSEGAVTGRVVATYLHGPVLARNPSLADLLLGWVIGGPLAPLALPEVTDLRRERLRRWRPWRRNR
jgi:CobQ-like glutamine amidotransferase family enzyme